jgi:hypothetical protein
MISALPREALKELNKEIREMIASAPKEKREPAVGQKAWFAFMAHCRATMAERFTAGMKAPEMAVVCKAIRQEDEAVYTAFVEKFRTENSPEKSPDNSAPPSDSETSAKPVKRVRLSPEQKAAKEATKSAEKEAKKAERARAKEAKEAALAEEKAAKKAEKARAKEAKDAALAEEKAAKKAEKARAKEGASKSPVKAKAD